MHNLRPAIPRAGAGGGAAVDRLALRETHRHLLRVRIPAHERRSWPPACHWWPTVCAQEALTNITKHAQATRGADRPPLAGGVMSLEIATTAAASRQRDRSKARSFGIRGLHERAGTVGGWIDLSSGPAPP